MSTELNPFEQLENEDNLQKYKDAGQVVTKVMNKLVKSAKPNKKLIDLSRQGNKFIKNELLNVQKDVKDKGILFPLCLSLNSVAGHNLIDDKDTTVLKDGDLLTIELGVQIDGFPSQIAFTTLVTNSKEKINDKRAKVMKATIEATRAVAKAMKPGTLNTDIVKIMQETAKKYDCSLPLSPENGLAPGIHSFQLSRYVVDGHTEDEDELCIHRFIYPRANPIYDFTLQEMPLEEDEVYAIDVVMCSGQGKLTLVKPPLIYKRSEKRAGLKLKASKAVLGKFKNEKYPIVINGDDARTKLGLKECVAKDLLVAYPIVSEKKGEFTARIKFTVIVRSKPVLLCGKQADHELSKLE
jgi:methionine aminopeptidase